MITLFNLYNTILITKQQTNTRKFKTYFVNKYTQLPFQYANIFDEKVLFYFDSKLLPMMQIRIR